MKPSKEELLIRASDAERLLSNPLLSSAVLAVKTSIFTTIEKSSWRHRGMREEAYRELKALNSVIKVLEREIQTGKLARNQLKVENKDR